MFVHRYFFAECSDFDIFLLLLLERSQLYGIPVLLHVFCPLCENTEKEIQYILNGEIFCLVNSNAKNKERNFAK